MKTIAVIAFFFVFNDRIYTQDVFNAQRSESASQSMRSYHAAMDSLMDQIGKQDQARIKAALISVGDVISSATVGWSSTHSVQAGLLVPLRKTIELHGKSKQDGMVIPSGMLADAMLAESRFDLYRVYLWREPSLQMLSAYQANMDSFELAVGSYVATLKIPALVKDHGDEAAVARAVGAFLREYGSAKVASRSGMSLSHNFDVGFMAQVVSKPEMLATLGIDLTPARSVRDVVNWLFEPDPGSKRPAPKVAIFDFSRSIYYAPGHGTLVQAAYAEHRAAHARIRDHLSKPAP